jgi:SAM-dependent methyltransferase
MTTPPAYGIRANPDLLPRIPLDARAILDVGCGAGGLGAAWRRRNPHTRLIAVEPDAALAAEAEPHYDEIHRLDIEAGSPPVAEGSLDALVFGDVLEHLRDPWAVLRGTARLLAPDGVLVACVPNVEHWSFAARLLMGGWRYEETGLFDRTHLRWFTRDGMHQALVEAGLVPVDVAPRIVDAPGIEDFVRRISPALQALGVEPAGYARRAAPLQYVWRATRRRPARLAVVARTLRPVGGINEVRIHEPLAALASRPGVVRACRPGRGHPADAARHPGHHRAAAAASERALRAGLPARAAGHRRADRPGVRRRSGPLAGDRGIGSPRLPRRACRADLHPGAARAVPPMEPGGGRVPERARHRARAAELHEPRPPDAVLRRAEPGGRQSRHSCPR